MPLCPAIKSHKGLREVRNHVSSPRIDRVLFCLGDGRMILLHAFIKKAQKTPERELSVAVNRMTGQTDD